MRRGDCWCYTEGVIGLVSDLLENGGSQREYERRAEIILWPRARPAAFRKERELQRAGMWHVIVSLETLSGRVLAR